MNIPKIKDLLDDEYMLLLVLDGMRNATALHGMAIQELVINKKLKGIFKNILSEEMEIIDNIVKYGKLKGWLALSPRYLPNQ